MNLASEYVFFDGERVARKDFPSGAVSYYFSDRPGTASEREAHPPKAPPMPPAPPQKPRSDPDPSAKCKKEADDAASGQPSPKPDGPSLAAGTLGAMVNVLARGATVGSGAAGFAVGVGSRSVINAANKGITWNATFSACMSNYGVYIMPMVGP